MATIDHAGICVFNSKKDKMVYELTLAKNAPVQGKDFITGFLMNIFLEIKYILSVGKGQLPRQYIGLFYVPFQGQNYLVTIDIKNQALNYYRPFDEDGCEDNPDHKFTIEGCAREDIRTVRYVNHLKYV